MSWTIENELESDEPTMLKDAITKAQEAHIAIFCSGSDKGENSLAYCYPGRWSDKCISIGALSAIDTPSVLLDPRQVNFMLPGENLLVQNNDGTYVEDSGSSLAAVIATGSVGSSCTAPSS